MKLKQIPVPALVKNLASLIIIAAQKLDVPVCSGILKLVIIIIVMYDANLYQSCAIMFLQLRIVLRQD